MIELTGNATTGRGRKISVTYTHRSKNDLLGRFGGGWQYKLGIQVGANTVIVSFLVSSLRIDWR